MLKICILCVGKLKERFYADAVAEYEKRLSRHCRLEITELAEQKLSDDPSPAEIAQSLAKEADAIEAKLPRGGAVVALCVEGKTMPSPAFSDLLQRYAASGTSQITFLIGGSFGLHERVKQRADLRLSVSPMTFPHHLFRVMLLEQIYRAFEITNGSKYHK